MDKMTVKGLPTDKHEAQRYMDALEEARFLSYQMGRSTALRVKRIEIVVRKDIDQQLAEMEGHSGSFN